MPKRPTDEVMQGFHTHLGHAQSQDEVKMPEVTFVHHNPFNELSEGIRLDPCSRRLRHERADRDLLPPIHAVAINHRVHADTAIELEVRLTKQLQPRRLHRPDLRLVVVSMKLVMPSPTA